MSQFPPQQPMYQMPPAAKPAGMAIASMVLGIVSLITFCFWPISVPCGVVALVLGIIANGKAARGEGGGGGMAKTGLILGLIGMLVSAALTISAIMFGSSIQQKVQQMQQQQMQQMQQQMKQQQHGDPGATASPTMPEAPAAPAHPGDPNAPQGNPLGKP